MRIKELGILESVSELELPLAIVSIPAGTGFPSPADDYIEDRLDWKLSSHHMELGKMILIISSL